MGSYKIFIVEDDALVISHLEQILRDYQYKIAGTAATGPEAIKKIKETQPDLVIMDIRLRGEMDGLQTAEKIRTEKSIPIIFLTAYANEYYLEKAQQNNSFSYLVKPVRGIDLHSNIQISLHRHKIQERLTITNKVLEIRQKVNRLFLKIKSPEQLLKKISTLLYDVPAFSCVCILKNNPKSSFDFFLAPDNASWVQNFKSRISQKKLPYCAQQALEKNTLVTLESFHPECHQCPLFSTYRSSKMISYPLRYKKHLYGIIMILSPEEYARIGFFQELIQDLGDDIAFALYNIELEKTKIQINKALQESEEKYRILSEQSLTGVYLIQEDKLVYANPKLAEIFGYHSPRLLVNKNIADLLPENTLPEIKKIITYLLQGRGTDLKYEFQAKKKDGSFIDVETFGKRIQYNGKPAVLGVILDITERKKNIQTIQKLSKAIEQSPVATVITDTSGTIEYVNPAFTEITGYTYEEAIGQNPRILKSGKMPEELYKDLWDTITHGKVWKGEMINRRKDGALIWEYLVISPLFNEQGEITHFLASKENITEKKKLENDLLQKQKMEAIGRLAGGIAHDFNNMLTVINGYSQLILHTMSVDDPLYKKIEQIYQAGERAKNLTSQLLTFSRKQIRQPDILNLNTLIHDMEKMLTRLIGEDVQIITQLDEKLWPIESDKGQLEQILLNLAINARQAMPEGGQLRIRTQNILLDESFVATHPGTKTGKHVLLEITDTGQGMDEETQKHIFEPFFTTKPTGQGTGLGLATVYGIVKQNEGHIEVKSRLHHGTTFSIYFPAVENTLPKTPSHQDQSNEFGGSETIFLVEDDPSVRELTSKSLNYFGYKVIIAKNGREALQMTKAPDFHFDLLITDVVMPEISGRKLVDLIKAKHPTLKVLFMSGYTEDHISEKGVQNKEINFIQKPFAPLELAKKVRQILNAH